MATTVMNKLRPPTTIERYFSLHYGLSFARPMILAAGDRAKGEKQLTRVERNPLSAPAGEDTCIARHHNGICIVCLSPRHPIITEQKKLINIEYRVPFRAVKGKRKKGGIVVENVTRLCFITCESGEKYGVQCAVKGTLIEYNDYLENSPQLASQKPLTDGYLAIVLPFLSQIKTAVDSLTTEGDYEKLWQGDHGPSE